jgi:hypothetical protein
MRATLKVSPLQKDKFKHVLEISNGLKITDISIISEGDDFFEIEYQREQHLFNLGRAFEPYKMPTNMGSSFTFNQDNSFIYKI